MVTTQTFHIVYYKNIGDVYSTGKDYEANDMIDALTMFDLDEETPSVDHVVFCSIKNLK